MAQQGDIAAAATAASPGAGQSGLPAVRGVWRRRIAVAVAATLSLLLHAGALHVALSSIEQIQKRGAIALPSDAISVELFASPVLEALQPKESAEPAPAPEATAPVKGGTEPSEESAGKSAPRPEPEAVKAPAAAAPDPKDDESRAARLGETAETPNPPAPVEAPAEVVREPHKAEVVGEEARAKRRRVKQERKATRRVRKGGTTSKARRGKGRDAARASASRGSILNYAARVRARVAPTGRRSGGTGGTAIVAFGLTPSGRLAFARIARSSGNAANDRIALGVVRGAAPFPPPPAGATLRQLQFTIPYSFR